MNPSVDDKPTRFAGVRHALAVLSLAAVVCWLFAALATDERIRTHEGHWLYARTAAYLSEIEAGQIPPQVFPETVAGGGSAFPVYYPPAAYLISCVTSTVAGDVERGVHLSFALSASLSAVLFYFVAHRLTRSSAIALLGAVLYLGATYRFVDILVRGALAECWTFVWYPPIALGVVRILQGRGMRWYLPACLGMMLLTHTVMTLYTIALVAPVLLARLRRTWAPGALSLALAFGLAAWYLVPMARSLEDVRAGIPDLLSSAGSVAFHTPSFAQLFRSSPAQWFGDSMPGEGDGMSFALGPADFALLPVLVLCLGFVLVRRRGATSWNGAIAPTAPLVATMLWAVAVVFVLAPEPFLAFAPRQFQLIQFSWRLLGHTTFLAALAIVLWLAWLREMAKGRVADRFGGILAVGCAVVVVLTVPAHHRAAQLFPPQARPPARTATMSGYTVLGEYLPRELSPEHADYKVRQTAKAIESLSPAIRFERDGSTSRVHVKLERAGGLTLPLLYYDFYAARSSNGDPVPIVSNAGLVRLRLRPGDYTVEVAPQMTVPRWIGAALSLLAAVGIAAFSRRSTAT